MDESRPTAVLMIRLAFVLVAALFARGAVAEPVTLIAADGVQRRALFGT